MSARLLTPPERHDSLRPSILGRGGRAWASLLLALALTGCHLTPDRVAMNSLQAIKVSAESSLRVAASLYNDGEIRESQWNDVVDAYKRVQAGCKTAAAGLALVKTEGDAEALCANAKRLLDELKSLVESFAPKKTALWIGGVAWAC